MTTRRDQCEGRPGDPADRDSRPGRSATPAPASRCSASRGCPVTPSRRSPTPPRSTATPGSPRGGPAHPLGLGRRLRPAGQARPGRRASSSAPSTPTSSRTTTTSWAVSATPTPGSVAKALDHLLECVDIMDVTGPATSSCGSPTAPTTPARTTSATARTAWPRPFSRLPAARRRPAAGAGVQAVRAGLLPHRRARLGHRLRPLPPARRRTMVVVDTGHHAPGTNIEFIVAFLLREQKLGAFDFNSRFYADDDLMAGAADPFQLFRIMYEVVRGGGFAPEAGVCFMLDQCHNIERKIPGQIRSVLNVQELTAKALLVDRDALHGGPGGRRRARRQRRADGRLLDRRAAAAGRAAHLPGPRPRPDGFATPVLATTSGSWPSGSAAARPGGVPEGCESGGSSPASTFRNAVRPPEPIPACEMILLRDDWWLGGADV